MTAVATSPIGPPRAPSRSRRIAAVWYRHFRVYRKHLLANATPALFEPIFFLLALGLGVGRFIEGDFNGLDYTAFIAPGILGMTAIYTASFEATYGTLVRLLYQQTYDAMRATPLTIDDIFVGELLWCATKGLIFTSVVGLVLLAFGVVLTPLAVLVPVLGFLTAAAFAGMGFLVTALVKNMNQFQYFFTLVLTPLMYFSGMMFPVQALPSSLAWVAYALPMFHIFESFRMVISGPDHLSVAWAWICPLVLGAYTVLFGWLGVRQMKRRLLAVRGERWQQ